MTTGRAETEVLIAETEVLIVGGGHAGVQLAVNLAKQEHPPSVMLVGDEAVLPYERPPLTKRLLYGEAGQPPVLLRSAEYWQRSPVALRIGERVLSIDAAARTVRTSRDVTIGYRRLVWAAGGRAAASGLPGEDLPGVHTIRDFADLTALRTDLGAARSAVIVGDSVAPLRTDVGPARSAVIIGGGYIGLETAAALRQLGVTVTVVEVAPRLLARVAGPSTSRFFLELHRSRGVDVRLGVGVSRIVGAGGRVVGVALADGTQVPADVVVVGVGMRPNVLPLLEAGADGDAAGIDVDGRCRTSLPDVYAIGDCARQVNPWAVSAAPLRVESVHNAGQHAAVVAHDLGGGPAGDRTPPRFWSTQHGQELKTVGLPAPGDDELLRGDPAGGQFSVVYLREGQVVALDTMNRPRDFARGQALVAARWRPPNPDALVDPVVDLPRLEPAAR